MEDDTALRQTQQRKTRQDKTKQDKKRRHPDKKMLRIFFGFEKYPKRAVNSLPII